MRKVVNIDGVPDVDLLISYVTNPPLIVPISDMAKKALNLPEDCDCGVFLKNSPGEVLAQFDGKVLVGQGDYNPTKIASLTIKLLH